jgi:putative transposase
MRCLTTGSTGGMDSFSKTDINPSYAKKTPICWNWFGIFISESESQFSRKYKLKRLGYDFEKGVERVCKIFQMDKEFVTGRGKQRDRVRARDLLCYWAVVDLGIPMVDVARRLGITPAAVSYSVQRGEKTAKEEDYQLELMNF